MTARRDDKSFRLGGPRQRRNRFSRRLRAESQLNAIRQNEDRAAGRGMVSDRSASGSISGVVIMSSGPQGGISSNPTHSIAWRIRNALSPHQTKRPDCTVYDATGKAIAVIDGETRARRPIGTAS